MSGFMNAIWFWLPVLIYKAVAAFFSVIWKFNLWILQTVSGVPLYYCRPEYRMPGIFVGTFGVFSTLNFIYFFVTSSAFGHNMQQKVPSVSELLVIGLIGIGLLLLCRVLIRRGSILMIDFENKREQKCIGSNFKTWILTKFLKGYLIFLWSIWKTNLWFLQNVCGIKFNDCKKGYKVPVITLGTMGIMFILFFFLSLGLGTGTALRQGLPIGGVVMGGIGVGMLVLCRFLVKDDIKYSGKNKWK